MIAVSTKFTNTQKAPANLPVSQVQLVLGNYASSAAYGTTIASSSDFSADYPALGAIDGDRTEINVGPAAGADDFVGKSSWRSGGKPDLGDTVTLTLTFLASKTINRIKLYNLNNHGLNTYSLSYWNGSAFVVFAATSDIVSGGQTSITPTYELDTIDFSDISTTQIKLIVTHTQVTNDYANVAVPSGLASSTTRTSHWGATLRNVRSIGSTFSISLYVGRTTSVRIGQFYRCPPIGPRALRCLRSAGGRV